MSTSKWFDRKFEFNLGNEDIPALYERLQQTIHEARQAVATIPNDKLEFRPEGKWSIKEHIGHLCVLEVLWQQRITDFQQNRQTLTAADLDNKATTEGKFNNWKIADLIKRFTEGRNKTLQMVSATSEGDKTKTSFHPRLQQQLRLVDHLYFVAEHDDHHLGKIREIRAMLNS